MLPKTIWKCFGIIYEKNMQLMIFMRRLTTLKDEKWKTQLTFIRSLNFFKAAYTREERNEE